MKLLEFNRIRNMPVMQATFNPKGPGAVRIHLVPPRVSAFMKIAPGLIIINGNDIIPVRKSHMILLANFMEELNKYDGEPITQKDMDNIIDMTVDRTRKTYYRTKPEVMVDDLKNLVEDFCRMAYGEPVKSTYGVISIGEYAKYMRGPHRMDLMVSSMSDENGNWHCNNQCLHCYAAGQTHAGEKELSTFDWYDIVDKLYEAHVTQVTFTGGEPTLRKDLPVIVRHAKYFITRINTNGILLDKEYCMRLVYAELDSIQVTLYSDNEEIHNKLVGSNSWKDTVQGIKNAVEAGLSVSINTPLCSLNKDFESTLKFVNSLGIRYVSCSSIITTGNALNKDAEKTQLTEEDLLDILKKATAYAEKTEMELAFTSPGWVEPDKLREMKLKVPTCGACLSNMAITPSGKVVPCQSWLTGTELGDILNDDWKDIWDNETTAGIREFSARMENVCPLRFMEDVNKDEEM